MIMFYKIVHDYVAIELPTFSERPLRYTRHMHPLAFRQIHTAVRYYQHSFNPASMVLCNRLSSEVVLLEDLDSFRKGVYKMKEKMYMMWRMSASFEHPAPNTQQPQRSENQYNCRHKVMLTPISSSRIHAHAVCSDFYSCKNDHFQLNFFFYIFLIFAQNIDCGYTLDLRRF